MKNEIITWSVRGFVWFSLALHTLLLKQYRGLTQFVNKKVATEMSDYGKMVVQDYEQFLLESKAHFSLEGSSILEIGTGNSLHVALQLALSGNDVTTLDRFKHVANFSKDVTDFCQQTGIICEVLSPVSARVGSGSITYAVQALESHNNDWISKFDLVLSRATLEHVEDPELCAKNLVSYSKSTAIQCHEIDHRDHGIFSHFKIFSNMAFHKLNTETWSELIRLYPGIPNKVNASQYQEVFMTAGCYSIEKFCRHGASGQTSQKVDSSELPSCPVSVLVMGKKVS